MTLSVMSVYIRTTARTDLQEFQINSASTIGTRNNSEINTYRAMDLRPAIIITRWLQATRLVFYSDRILSYSGIGIKYM